jgi:predicted TIM-barrel fold metal-dependent hydrolase
VPGIRTAGQQGSYVPKQPPAGALAELRRLYYDTAQCANPVAMHALRQVVGTSQILFGTDHFYRSSAETADALQGCGVFSDRELESVGRSNALRLWPRLGR